MLDVATTADVSQARIGRFELGHWVRDVDRIVQAYADELGVTPDVLWREALDRPE